MRFQIILFFTFLPFLAYPQPETRTVNVLAVYACDADDHYPFPSDLWRQNLHERLRDFYKTISYGRHIIRIREATNAGDFFRSKHTAGYYKQNYDKAKHDYGFAMFNEEILDQVKSRLGENIFKDIDIIILFGTDGGPDWYINRVNATGYGALGVTYSAGQCSFHRQPGGGGFTVELGSDYGTPDSDDDQLLSLQQIHWTLAHEYGHWLGLRHRPKRLGIYSLLTPELYGNERMPEYGPPPLDIFEIIELGWLNENNSDRVKTITEDVKNYRAGLKQIRSASGVVLLKIVLAGIDEKVYISYHNQNNRFDGVYPGKGLLIWRNGYAPDLIRHSSNKLRVNAPEQNPDESATDFWDGRRVKTFSHVLRPASKRKQVSVTYNLEINNIKLGKEKTYFNLNLTKN